MTAEQVARLKEGKEPSDKILNEIQKANDDDYHRPKRETAVPDDVWNAYPKAEKEMKNSIDESNGWPERANPPDFSDVKTEEGRDILNEMHKITREGRAYVFYNKNNHDSNKHAFPPGRVREIIEKPEVIFISDSQAKRLIYLAGGDIVVVETKGGGAQKKVVTAYGATGILSKSGQKEYPHMSPEDPGVPVTEEMILKGDKVPKGKKIWSSHKI